MDVLSDLDQRLRQQRVGFARVPQASAPVSGHAEPEASPSSRERAEPALQYPRVRLRQWRPRHPQTSPAESAGSPSERSPCVGPCMRPAGSPTEQALPALAREATHPPARASAPRADNAVRGGQHAGHPKKDERCRALAWIPDPRERMKTGKHHHVRGSVGQVAAGSGRRQLIQTVEDGASTQDVHRP